MSKRKLSEGAKLAQEAQEAADDKVAGTQNKAARKKEETEKAKATKRKKQVDEYVLIYYITVARKGNLARASVAFRSLCT